MTHYLWFALIMALALFVYDLMTTVVVPPKKRGDIDPHEFI